MSAAALRAVPPPVSIVEGLSYEDVLARRDILSLTFDRRIRYRDGRGCWRDWRVPTGDARFTTCRDQPWRADLVVPPVGEWTRETVTQVIAIARTELVKRGARGRYRITAAIDSSYTVNVVIVIVRVGDLRTEVRIDAGVIRFEVPVDVVATLADLAPHRDLTDAVKRARAHNRKGGA